jgi:excisionase family DNA binding protein
MGKMIDTKTAATELKVSQRRVQQLIEEKRLPAQLIGGAYIIDSDDLDKVRERPTGRPTRKRKRLQKPSL